MKDKYVPIITKAMIVDAYNRSNNAAGAVIARMLGVNYATYKKWATYYGLFEEHKKVARRVQPNGDRHRVVYDKIPLSAILDGYHPLYPTNKLKARLIFEGIFPDACMSCGYDRARSSDGQKPLLLLYKDGKFENKMLENLILNCYNCAFEHLEKKSFLDLIKKSTTTRVVTDIEQIVFTQEEIASDVQLTEEEKARIRQEIDS